MKNFKTGAIIILREFGIKLLAERTSAVYIDTFKKKRRNGEMDFFDVLTLIGGLCLFLFGMNIMGESLERSAGDGLKNLLGRLTTSKAAGFFTGLGVTAVIQSSSATTVMVVGFVNSGLMTLTQAINVIMGANVGTTVTAWILSLTGIEGSSFFVTMLKPTSFTPILALIGIVMTMASKSNRKKDIGTILLGFATLMFGMDAMSGAVAGLKEVEGFRNILVMFSNPVLGVLAGAILTAIIQSSSASVGILQALSSTGQITVGTSIPIIMGQNIGTCVTALISSIGTNRNARRASMVHLSFNVIGTIVLLILFWLGTSFFDIALIGTSANQVTIAVAHTAFNILCTIIMLPLAGLLEKLSYRLVPEPEKSGDEDEIVELDERLMTTPAIALDRCRVVANTMAKQSIKAFKKSLNILDGYDADEAEKIRKYEKTVDHYEDILGSYLVKLNTTGLSDKDSHESSKLLFVIGDFERISDHAVNIMESSEEIMKKETKFSEVAVKEISQLINAANEIVDITYEAFKNGDLGRASQVEPLEQVIDKLRTQLKANHIARLQKNECSIEAGFIWADILNNIERVADHCSNIAVCVLEMSHKSLGVHEYLHNVKKNSPEFLEMYNEYLEKYKLN